ncbi:MAG: phage holin family protein [Candidatus Eisenbacteria bacterium]|uniref:Phage holin family protein n=1 Tax=Eiseniibacteriota bacterium TaxID=2212470 RepID=A0A538U321_UNCEI|nr:MAG: phage holin family protein [Candidatus Eisenbacteria bacterium]
MSLLLYFVVMAAAMLGLSRVLPGFRVNGWVPALFAAVVLAAVNTVVKPILFVLTLPFTILTLGLFLFVLNAICLWITALIVPGFTVIGEGTTIVASVVLALVGMLWKAATRSS